MADNGSFYYHIQGTAEGTSYSIIYQDEDGRNFQPDIILLLNSFERSLSVYDETSIISRVNRNESVVVDSYFEEVFNKAKDIYAISEGAFDMSAEPLFKAWGFGAGERNVPDDNQIKELKKYIGMDKVRLEDRRVIKSNPNIILNANAIAKGYSADIIARFLDEHGSFNYMVEIGGEIRVKGENLCGLPWRIGIDRPSEDNLIPGQDLQVVLEITDKGIATSGNYRQFYIEGGEKVWHTINPSTGYPVRNNLLSVTVVADEAITADAFATAFLVGGVDKAIEWIGKYPYIDALFICEEAGEYKVYCTQKMEDYVAIIR